MLIKFKQKLINNYINNSIYKHIFKIFDINSDKNVVKLSFLRKHEFIFRLNFAINDHAFTFKRLCTSNLCIKKIL